MESADPSAGAAERRRTLAVAFAGFSAFLGLYVTQPLLPMFEHLFKASKATVSLTLTASTLGVAIAAPLIGSVADRLGRKRVIVGSAGLLTLATLLSATSTGLGSLILWRFFQGLFTPGVFAVTVAYVQEEWAGGAVGRALSIYVTGTVIGGFTSRIVSGIIVSHWHWQWAFVATGAMVGASALVLQAWLPRESRFAGRARGQSLAAGAAAHFANPRLVATFAVGFGVLFTLVATFTYVTFHLAGPPFHLGPLGISLLFCTYLFGAAVTPPCGHIIDRYGQRAALALAMGTGAAGMVLTLVPSLWVVIAGLALCCSGVFVAQACSTSFIGMTAGSNKALAVGLYVTCYYIGGSAGAELPGFLWRFGGWPACVGLVILVQLLTIWITRVFWDVRRGGRGEAYPLEG
ncbi:MFS transporter [Geothrix sp. 21YS21S-2]|uniref:MFS transporter n=1 Tax=Geothrix sp. 21YS21S-2 TaxID=3068893 RepID=UPI0027B8CA86|nr:MFS transporter [Geothrix sp. 21YS21S-2]